MIAVDRSSPAGGHVLLAALDSNLEEMNRVAHVALADGWKHPPADG